RWGALEGRCARRVETDVVRRVADCGQAPYESGARRARVRVDDRVADWRGPPDQEPLAPDRAPRRFSPRPDCQDAPSRLAALDLRFSGPPHRDQGPRHPHAADALRRVSIVPGVLAAAVTTNPNSF